MSDELVYVGSYPDTLEDGRPLANGQAVRLTSQERDLPHNKRLIDEHRLVERPDPTPAAGRRTPRKDGEDQ